MNMYFCPTTQVTTLRPLMRRASTVLSPENL
jgi:hypothetical protein